MARPNLFDFFSKRRAAKSPDDASQPAQQQPVTVASQQQQELPKIDGSNAIGSLSKILGPSPEERATEEQRLQDHRQKMHGWTALFNGLRHLGNLYYATKGAPGQKLSDHHQQVEQQYQDERKRLADIQAANRNYYANLYNLRRQMEADRRTGEEHQAKLDWYKNRDEIARQNAEIAKLKSVQVIKNKDGSLMKYDPVSGTLEQLSEADPLYEEYMRSRINRNYRKDVARPVQESVTTITEDGNGKKTIEKRAIKPQQSGGNGSGASLLPKNNQQQGGSLLPKKK